MKHWIYIFLLLGFAPPAVSIIGDTEKIQISEELTLRVSEKTSSGSVIGRPVGILPEGSIVDIPRKYIVRDEDGKINIDFTIQKWFEKGGKTFQTYGEDFSLFYTPIKIVHPKMPHLRGKKLYVGLEDLRLRDKDKTLMTVIEPTELVSIMEQMEQETEAGAVCSGECAGQEPLSQGAEDVISSLKEIEKSIKQDRKSNARSKRNSLVRWSQNFDKTLKNSCGISEQELCSEMSAGLEQQGLPIDVKELAGLVLIESVGGLCTAVNSRTLDHGLFQININNLCEDLCYVRERDRWRNHCENMKTKPSCQPRSKICTNQKFAEKAAKAGTAENSMQFWSSQAAPQCTFNPMYSLKKALKILNEAKMYIKRHLPQIDENSLLFKRLLLSSYNGGVGHAVRAVKDLLSFNDQMQKKLAEGGMDITRANRNILEVKKDIGELDQTIAHFIDSIDHLKSQIDSVEEVNDLLSGQIGQLEKQTIPSLKGGIVRNEEKLGSLSQNLAQNMRAEEQRQQQAFQKIRADVQADQTRIGKLVQQWNDLNEQDIGVIRSQQNILSSLDTPLESIRGAKRTVPVLSREYQRLELYEQALVRLASEIEEEKWPYYLDQLENTPKNVNSTPADKPAQGGGPLGAAALDNTPSNKPLHRRILNPIQTAGKRVLSPIQTAGERVLSPIQTAGKRVLSPIQRDYRFFRGKINKMKRTARRFIERFNPDIEDVYGISALEARLDSLHSRKNRRKTLSRMGGGRIGSAPKFFAASAETNGQIQELTKQLEKKREQRSQDIARILDEEYRKSLSEEELAYAQKIIENQAGELQFGLGRPGKDNFVSNAAAFFSPHAEVLSGLEKIYEELESRRVQKKQERNAEMREERDRKYREEFRSRRQQLSSEQNSTAQNTEQLTKIADKEQIQMDYLRRLLNSQGLIPSLRNWKRQRASIDSQRQELEGNEFFQKMRPYLSRQRGSSNLVVGARAGHFFQTQELAEQNKILMDQQALNPALSVQTGMSVTRARRDSLQDRLNQTEQNLQRLIALQNDQTRELQNVQKARLEKQDRKTLLENERGVFEKELAARKKDPNNWEDIKLFYYASKLREQIRPHYCTPEEIANKTCELDNEIISSRRSEANASINIEYVDSILGVKGQEGFVHTTAGKNICSGI